MFPQSVREIDAHSQRNTGPAIQDRLSGISRHRRDVGWCASSVRCATAVDCGEHARSITTTKRASSAATSVDTATPDWTAACISRAVHGPVASGQAARRRATATGYISPAGRPFTSHATGNMMPSLPVGRPARPGHPWRCLINNLPAPFTMGRGPLKAQIRPACQKSDFAKPS